MPTSSLILRVYFIPSQYFFVLSGGLEAGGKLSLACSPALFSQHDSLPRCFSPCKGSDIDIYNVFLARGTATTWQTAEISTHFSPSVTLLLPNTFLQPSKTVGIRELVSSHQIPKASQQAVPVVHW